MSLGALENASAVIKRLKLERLQMDFDKSQLDENLKAANLEITRRLRERDLLKRELRNTQFDASRNLQDAQIGELLPPQSYISLNYDSLPELKEINSLHLHGQKILMTI